MFAVISPAKNLTSGTDRAVPVTQPVFQDEMRQLVGVARDLEPADLKSLMKISDKLAALNHERYQRFELPLTEDNAVPAALLFNGDTYRGLSAADMSDADLAWAQAHLGILSGLYGLLRPLDLAAPYRLEMGTRLEVAGDTGLYKFWGDKLTQRINALTEGHEDRTVVNLASNEYFSAVKPAKLDGQVITPVFKEVRDGKAKIISFFAKQARGAMARYIIENRLEHPEALKRFDRDGYRYDPDGSTASSWLFVRPDSRS